MDPLIGKTVGQYQIVELAGQGGMATVFKAFQPSLNRYVALKVLPEYLAHDDEFVKRFKQEATAAAALRHPNIIVIYDIGEAGNVHYIATEFLKGQTLDAALKQSGALSVPRAVKIVNQLASALEAAHQQGLIHRDVKPSNVFVNARDHVTQARERAADFVHRVPNHPDPERVLKLSPGAPASGLDAGWMALWLGGLALAVGALLGFWAVPKEGRWAWARRCCSAACWATLSSRRGLLSLR